MTWDISLVGGDGSTPLTTAELQQQQNKHEKSRGLEFLVVSVVESTPTTSEILVVVGVTCSERSRTISNNLWEPKFVIVGVLPNNWYFPHQYLH